MVESNTKSSNAATRTRKDAVAAFIFDGGGSCRNSHSSDFRRLSSKAEETRRLDHILQGIFWTNMKSKRKRLHPPMRSRRRNNDHHPARRRSPQAAPRSKKTKTLPCDQEGMRCAPTSWFSIETLIDTSSDLDRGRTPWCVGIAACRGGKFYCRRKVTKGANLPRQHPDSAGPDASAHRASCFMTPCEPIDPISTRPRTPY